MSEVPAGFEFSCDDDRMDRSLIHRWLSEEAYWALGRSRELQDAAIDGSRNYGLFRDSGEQVAYARVVTDRATFAWLCDVFVEESVRGLALGVTLVDAVCADLDALGVRRTLLATSSAHTLYEKFGFAAVDPPENWMIKIRTDQVAPLS